MHRPSPPQSRPFGHRQVPQSQELLANSIVSILSPTTEPLNLATPRGTICDSSLRSDQLTAVCICPPNLSKTSTEPKCSPDLSARSRVGLWPRPCAPSRSPLLDRFRPSLPLLHDEATTRRFLIVCSLVAFVAFVPGGFWLGMLICELQITLGRGTSAHSTSPMPLWARVWSAHQLYVSPSSIRGFSGSILTKGPNSAATSCGCTSRLTPRHK
jgi:hypothetical protein